MVLNDHPNAHPSAGAYTNAPEVAAAIIGIGPRAARKAVAVTRHHGMLLETRIKANASGRPGPRARTDDYRASWTTDVAFDGSTVSATVGTNKPQGRRLEYGFVGEDRIGRVFNQPPFPHAGPAAETIRPGFEKDIGDVASWGGTR